ncbi:MAG: autotransporter-associated beta strand repeat-containing protein, partial [Kiritimatiellia bacterium]|nr:autotransporter-associated beta strand repeat-containing protein [Kiritimatiellia bacterium]
NFDEGGTTFTIATSYSTHGYGVAESAATIQRESVLTLAGTNSYTGGTEVRGGVLEVVSTNGLPATGMIQVNGGEMILRVPGMNVGNPGGVGNNNTLFVNSGGKLTLAREFNAGYSRPILLDGGILNCTFYQGNDSANYVNRLTLRNGARTIGYKLRVGYNSSALYTVSGTQPSVIESGLNLARSGSYSLTVDVHDVTSDPLPDLIISGVIRDYDASISELPFIKTGPGTLSLSGANTHVGLITVNGGAISLGANATLNPGNPIRLNGGSLEMGAFTNTLGALTLGANSGLTLGSGQIAFADSSAEAWSGTLALTGTLHRFSVRFGTDGSGLTAAQVSAIRLNGDFVRLRDDGYLSPGMKGTVLSIF